MESVVLMSIKKEELISLIENSVHKALKELNLNSKSSSEEQLLTLKETAKFLKLSIPTIYSYISNRKIPCFKKGNRIYFKRNVLLDWISEGKLKSMKEIENESSVYITRKK